MKLSNKSRKGFTLVELLVVIAIIGVLAALAIPRFTDATASARGAKVVADLRTIDSALSLYNTQYGSYPASVAALATANLLAAEPKPQTGTSKINAKDVAISGTNYGISNGRATVMADSAAKTVDALLQ